MQAQPQALSPRLCERLEALGLTAVGVGPDGRAVPLGEARWIERLILQSPPFAAALRQAWPALSEGTSQVVPIWPGVTLAPLPLAKRRRSGALSPWPVTAVLMLGPDLLQSDQLRLVCDAHQRDWQDTLRRIDPHTLLTPQEVQRLAATLAWMCQDISEAQRRTDEIQTLSQELSESYEELSLLYKLSSNMAVNQPPQVFLTDACRELQQVVGLQWIALQLIEDDPRLEDLAGQVFRAGPIDCDDATLKQLGQRLMERFGAEAEPTVIDDTASLDLPPLSRLARNLLLVPLRRKGQPLGVLVGGNKLDGTAISTVDSKLCGSLASSLSIFLDNRMLYEDVQAMFLGTLHALTSAIDAKDSYTRGHSERVALLSRQLAHAAGLDDQACQRVYIAGLVHDVGKIGVPEAVLCKPGRLTDEEFALIKMHPQIGAHILADIRQMQDLIPGVLYHHERWDGRGYPRGLVAQQIPLLGRLICLADSFDAMSSSRTYRQAMGLDQVLREIRRCSGRQFDPDLTKIFLQLDFQPYLRAIRKHQRYDEPAGPAEPTGLADASSPQRSALLS
ncbi:MAG TPA: HD domain-containing phosphohydrolase [Phycisphaeraceae bacterium]